MENTGNEVVDVKKNDSETIPELSVEENLPAQEITPEPSGGKKSRTTKPVRSFPSYSIREAMQIPRIIGTKNAGNPWSPEHVASALNTSRQNNSFFYLTSASRDYGFTIGTSRAKTIELTALGRKLVFPESSNEEGSSILVAFNNIQVFKDVYEYYNHGANLPEDKYLCNTLRETFDVDSTYHNDFIEIFKDNLKLIAENGYSAVASTQSTVFTPQVPPVSEKASGTKGLFVIMPFSEKTGEYPKGYFDEVYNSLIVPAAAEAGFTAKTAKRSGSDIIHSTIVSDIYYSEVILADLTEHNPNVLFELGLAIAFKKKVALIRAKGTTAIFDVDNLMRVYDYDKNLWKSTIERDIPSLSNHINSTIQADGTSYLDLLLKNK
ncbi:MAG: hypothetical protein ACYCX2_08950 [Christensenellales bacterium]